MVIVENIIDKYYFYSAEILWGLSFVFMIFAIGAFIYAFTDFISCCWKTFNKVFENRSQVANNEGHHSKSNKTTIRYNINKLIYKIIYSVIVVGIGKLLCLMGAKLEIKYVYFNAVAFIFIVGATVVYGILLCIMFRQILLPMQQSCRYVQFFIFLELFLLAITQHLDFWEWVTATLGIVSAEMMTNLLEKLAIEQKRKKEKKKNKGYDYPDPDLYPTRQRQLERFIAVLEEQRYEPYAVMISGEWGKGKTSFVKALEKELKENCFKWIYAGSEKTVSEIMSEISSQILEVLKENNIFLDRKDLIENYFLAFSDLLEDTALKPLKKLASAALNKQSADEREYLNSKLDELDKVIYLIIDDLDRCDGEYQKKMFKVIRESMELHNCKTIFLLDRAIFLKDDKDYDVNFAEKYVSYTLDLCKVSYQEIMTYQIGGILNDEFIQEMNKVISGKRSAEQIIEEVFKFPLNLIMRFKKEILKEEDNIERNKDKKNDAEKRIGEISQIIDDIENAITNSRKVKNYLKGIKRDIDNLNIGIEKCSEEFLKEDWFKAVIEVQFVRNFMPVIFNDIKMSGDIIEYEKTHQGYVVEIILDLYYGIKICNEKKAILLNYIIYKIDVINFSQVRTHEEKCLARLRGDKGVINEINEYLKYAQSSSDFEKILHIYKTQRYDGTALENDFVEKILRRLMETSYPFKANTQEYLVFSKKLIDVFLEIGLSETDKLICINYGKRLACNAMKASANVFKTILSILFPVTVIEDYCNILYFEDIKEVYDTLKTIDKDSTYKGLDDENNMINSIETYFSNLEIELRKEKYLSIGIDLENIFATLKTTFSVYNFWISMENLIVNSDQMKLFSKYFTVYMGKCEIHQNVYDNVTNLIEALEELKEFYISKGEDYTPGYLFLAQSLFNNIACIFEQNSKWFGDKKKEVVNLINEVAEIICDLSMAVDDTPEDNFTRRIRIYAYKISEYCKNEENVLIN